MDAFSLEGFSFTPIMSAENREELAVICEDAGSIGAVINVYQTLNLGSSVATRAAGTTPAGAPSATAQGIGALLEAKNFESFVTWCDLIQQIASAKDLASSVNALRTANRIMQLGLDNALEFYDDTTSLIEFSESLNNKLKNKSTRKSALLNASNHARYVNAYKKWGITAIGSEEGTDVRLEASKQAADRISYRVQAISDRILECKKAKPGVSGLNKGDSITIDDTKFSSAEISEYQKALGLIEEAMSKQEAVVASSSNHIRNIVLLLANSGAEVYAGGKLFQSINTRAVYVQNTYNVAVKGCDGDQGLNRVEEVVMGDSFRSPGMKSDLAADATRLCIGQRPKDVISLFRGLKPASAADVIASIARNADIGTDILTLPVDSTIAQAIPKEQLKMDVAAEAVAPEQSRTTSSTSCMPADEQELGKEIDAEMPTGGFPTEEEKRAFIASKVAQYRSCDRKRNGKLYEAAKFDNLNISTLDKYFAFYSSLMESWGNLNLKLQQTENTLARGARSFGAMFNRQFDDKASQGQSKESAGQLSFSASYQFQSVCSDKGYLAKKYLNDQKQEDNLYNKNDANATFVALKLKCQADLKDPKNNGETVKIAGQAYVNAVARYMTLRAYNYALRIKFKDFFLGPPADYESCAKTQQQLDYLKSHTELLVLQVQSALEINDMQRGELINKKIANDAAKEMSAHNAAKQAARVNKEMATRKLNARAQGKRDTNQDRQMKTLGVTVAPHHRSPGLQMNTGSPMTFTPKKPEDDAIAKARKLSKETERNLKDTTRGP